MKIRNYIAVTPVFFANLYRSSASPSTRSPHSCAYFLYPVPEYATHLGGSPYAPKVHINHPNSDSRLRARVDDPGFRDVYVTVDGGRLSLPVPKRKFQEETKKITALEVPQARRDFIRLIGRWKVQAKSSAVLLKKRVSRLLRPSGPRSAATRPHCDVRPQAAFHGSSGFLFLRCRQAGLQASISARRPPGPI